MTKIQHDNQSRSLSFWTVRAKGYNNLEWANHTALLQRLVELADLKPHHLVLDVGTGTGIVAKAMSKQCLVVIGIDTSLAMMAKFDGELPRNCSLVEMDVRAGLFGNSVFDRAVARYAVHHMVGYAQEAVDECYRMLKPHGMMIICEGTPPSRRVADDYSAIFALKEDRITLFEEDIMGWLREAGFKRIKSHVMWLRHMSVRNWLDSSGLTKETKDRIFRMHTTGASAAFKEDYNMVEEDGDCFIDMRQVIVTGVKG